MKLATYKDGSRDGQLLVVSRDLSQAHFATGIATRMQAVLDDWNFLSPQLEDLYATLNGSKGRHAFAWDPAQCMAPLPRAYQWAEARLPRTREEHAGDPQVARHAGDHFLGPREDAAFADTAQGIGCEPGLAVATGEVPMDSPPAQALEGVRLLMLTQGWTTRAASAGCEPIWHASAFSPVAATPDELGSDWRGGRVQLPLQRGRNGKPLDPSAASQALPAHFGQLISALAQARRLAAGSLVGCCIAEPAAGPSSDAAGLQCGDTLSVEMLGRDGLSVFGAIEQRITPRRGRS